MNKYLSHFLIFIFSFTSLFTHSETSSAQSSTEQNAPYIPVLMYHSFDEDPKFPGINTTPALFKEHLQTLKKNGYKTITNEQLAQYQAGLITLPDKSFMITIDDGFKSVYDNAYPILKELDMTATLFVITSHIESGERFDVPMASWEQLKEMSDSGYMEIGNHTHDLHWRGNNNQKGFEGMITNTTKDGKKITRKQRERIIVEDLTTAHELILQNIGTAPTVFSYPYGAYDKTSEKAVDEVGYRIIHTIIEAMNYPNENSKSIKRFGINEKVSSKKLLKIMRTH